MKKLLFGNPEKSVSNGFIWNTVSGLIMAGQSVLLLIIITRVCDLKAAGIFSIAYAIANLMLTIGKYGMRNYQVSDVKNRYSFQDYLYSRIVSSVLMIVISIGDALLGIFTSGYDREKVIVIILFCILKGIDAVEDVYHGFYQKEGRLDVAARAFSIRLLGTLVVLCVGVSITGELIISTAAACLFSIIVCVWFIKITYGEFRDKGGAETSFVNVKRLLMECFPLFAGGYLSMYIGNISKYAIDKYMSAEMQACYNFIFMPVFVIGLLSSFAFQPILGRMAVVWEEREYKKFNRMVIQQTGIVVVITAVVLLGAWLLGIPVLSLLYSTDLTNYKAALMVLLVGGSLYAVAIFFTVALTVIRKQNTVIWGYLVVAVISKMCSKYFVLQYGVDGAAVLYMLTMGLAMVLFLLILVFCVEKEKRLSL